MHLIIDILRNSILITGLVVVMMMMIESMNIESKGLFFKGLKKTKTGQVIVASLLGSIPGCMGGFATVSLYTHRMFSFGALVAMMIASSGDEAFIMLAMIPEQALVLFAVLFVLAIVTGIITDKIYDRIHASICSKDDHEDCTPQTECMDGYAIHDHHEGSHDKSGKKSSRHYGWKRMLMFAGLAVFITALASGRLGHEHAAHMEVEGHEHHAHCEHAGCTHEHGSHEDGLTIDLLSEDWMNVLFAGLSVIVLFVLLFASDHFVEEHLWNHIVRKHLPTIFAWTFGVLLVLGVLMQFMDIRSWISGNTVLMILLATAIGIIPESGPHMIFVTLFAAGVVPFPVLLASSISQDGHASLPLIAESRKSFLLAKCINCMVAIAAGLVAMLLC
ncbi:MAG: hypothetical protein E7118_07315 [Bacteroidales bacterium]|nr:hypothetical protein [Bacteroidales bacterium]